MSSCVLDDTDHLNDFTRKVIRQRIPLEGSLELTHRCNLRCIHCYLGDQEAIRQHRREELGTEELKNLIDQFTAAGMLNLLISGGDPMVRKDFPEIYAYAVQQGVRVTVFCDGVLITDRIIELFDKHPPLLVEVSLYGATEATYEAITQVKGSFKRCIAGIERLLAANHRLRLKTVLMTPNQHELAAMQAMADNWGVSFYFDTAVFPCLPHGDNGGQANRPTRHSVDVAPPQLLAPTQLRLSPREATEAHLANPTKARELTELYLKSKDDPAVDQLYTCGAAQTNFHVDPYGNLQACIISTNVDFNLRNGNFEQGWNGPLAALRQLRAQPALPCNSCDKRSICSGCPAMFAVENGVGDERVAYHCETTHTLHRQLGLTEFNQADEPRGEQTHV